MEKKYLIHQADNLSPRPLQSLGVYKSLDANILVAGSADRNLRFLEVDTFEEIAKYEVDKKSVNCVTISGISINGDDPFIITAGKDKAMQIWSPTSGNLGKDIELPTIEVLTLATYQGSASLVLIGTKDCKVLLWNITTNSLIHSFQGHRAGVYTVSITSTISFSDIQNDNDLQNLIIVSGSVDHTARTWNYNDGQKLQKFRHKRSVYSLVVTEKTPQPLLVTAGAEYLIRLWDIKSGFLLRTFDGHLARINSLCLWEDYQTLVLSASGDHTIRIHDLITGECICILQGHTGDVLTVLCTETDVNLLPSSTSTSTITSSSLSPRNVIVTSSEDLSLIQWDLQQIISDFYYTSGENCGVRNDNKPYLPLLQYIPPIETDIGNLKGLSKDEKRKLKKDMKRQKIHRMSVKYRRARSSMSQSSSIGGMDTSDMNNLEDDDDDEPFVFENLIDKDDDDDDDEIKNVAKTKKRGNSVDAFEQDLNEEAEAESYFMKIMNGENNEDDDEENNNKNTNSNTNTNSNKKKNSIKNSNNINNKDVISQISNEQQKINEIIPGNEVIVAVTDSTSKSRRSSWNQVLPFNSNNVDENRNDNHNNELFDITSKIRKASLTMVNSMMSIIGGNGSKSRHNSITKVGIDPNSTPTIIDPSIGLLNQKKDDINPRSRSSSEAASNNNSNNNNSDHKHVNHNHIDSNISSNVTPTLSRESQISQTNHNNNNNTTNNNSITPPRTPKSPATYSSNINDSNNNSSRPSVLQLSESNIKSRVQNTLTDYHVAQADDQLEADRRRQEASEKLAKRLKNKKNGGNDDNNATAEEKEFNSIKEKKLLQHKLQANRARKSLMISKERAAEVLQKRLDELNQKKLSNKESNKDKIGEDNGSDED